MKRIPLMLIMSCFLLTSCYEDCQPVDYDYLNGQTLVFVPPLSEKVDYVVYSWDNTKIATVTTMPFILHYDLVNQSSGSHTLKYKIVSNYGTSTTSYTYEKTFIIK